MLDLILNFLEIIFRTTIIKLNSDDVVIVIKSDLSLENYIPNKELDENQLLAIGLIHKLNDEKFVKSTIDEVTKIRDQVKDQIEIDKEF